MKMDMGRVSRALRRDDRGQDFAEYGIALAVIAGFVGLIAIFIGLASLGLWETAETSIGSAISGS